MRARVPGELRSRAERICGARGGLRGGARGWWGAGAEGAVSQAWNKCTQPFPAPRFPKGKSPGCVAEGGRRPKLAHVPSGVQCAPRFPRP